MESKEEIELQVHRVVAEQIGEHRAFLQTQFRHLTWGVGVIFSAAAIVFIFILGKSFTESKEQLVREVDKSVVEYRINENLKARVSEYVAAAVGTEVSSIRTQSEIELKIDESTKLFVDSFSTDIESQLRQFVVKEVERIKNLSAEELLRKAALPAGIVGAFVSRQCPSGWDEYVPGRGKFLRGIDQEGSNRRPGSIQEDAVQEHSHKFTTVPSKSHGPNDQHPHGYANGGFGLPVSATENELIGARSANETRPVNVAVLFCIKK